MGRNTGSAGSHERGLRRRRMITVGPAGILVTSAGKQGTPGQEKLPALYVFSGLY